MNKYHNTRVTVDGIKFDSKAEADRWCELMMLQKAGMIRNLERQVRIELQPKFVTAGDLVDGKVTIRAIVYVADFVYLDHGIKADHWEYVIEDKKGHKTKDYFLKKKMLLYKIAKGEIVGKFVET